MKHYGDITKLSGETLPIVDVITGGSPCQDLSVAGKRDGMSKACPVCGYKAVGNSEETVCPKCGAALEYTRSGLFMEQIRIVKEMRERDRASGRTGRLIRPRFMVWENVPGAFSNNGGKDFQAVLSEIVKIADPEAPDVPMPDKGGWSKAGCLYDEMGRWSIAWRVHDAQFWGVPQRRKRIALVADFGGLAAPEVLFERKRKGLSRDPEPSETARKTAPANAGVSADYAISFQERGGKPGGGKGILIQNELAAALRSSTIHAVCYPEIARALTARMDGSPCIDRGPDVVCVYDARGNGDGKIVPTITGDHGSRVTDYTALCVGNGQLNQMSMEPLANTLDTMHDQQAVLVAAGFCMGQSGKAGGIGYKEGKAPTLRGGQGGNQIPCMVAAVDCRNGTENSETNGTLQAKESGGTGLNLNNVCRVGLVVRRLTPLETDRLQGYPDDWTNIGDWIDSKGKKHKAADTPRYKADGNSIALPFWFWLMRRISSQYERPATLGSLFDGIGGFPLCWERCNGKGTALWASEIEEFPIAVTKKHFPEVAE